MTSFILSFIKVSKSRTQFLEFSILQKMNEKREKNHPRSSQDIFVSFFFEELRIPQIAFEIY